MFYMQCLEFLVVLGGKNWKSIRTPSAQREVLELFLTHKTNHVTFLLKTFQWFHIQHKPKSILFPLVCTFLNCLMSTSLDSSFTTVLTHSAKLTFILFKYLNSFCFRILTPVTLLPGVISPYFQTLL